MGWMSFENQVKMYQKYLARQPVPAIYVASGNLTSIEMFAKKVAPTPVVDKFNLLSPEDTILLKSMTWDQQGQLDYLVLTRASLYLSMADSLFSVNIASSRRAATKIGTCGEFSEPAKDVTYDDGLSVVVGRNRHGAQHPSYFWP
ncbi:hypothetical protein F5882DRAFT_312698 [Hyaloscypha sp. PMI_1271]|nr:hypothetical protein F5882DRAFT_312698 [Hyaloscypha sp. PMI_1271]